MSAARDPLRATARDRPDAVALRGPAGEVRYRELDARVDALARGLAAAARGAAVAGGAARTGSRGARGTETAGAPDATLAVVLPAGAAAAVSLIHAGPRAELVTAPLSPRTTRPELAEALDALDPALTVCDATTRAAVEAASGGRPVRTVDELTRREEGSGPLEPPPPARPRYALWTSGTTGRARGVLLTGANVEASARGSRRRLGLGPDDRWLLSLSPAHVGGLAMVLRAARLGSTLVVRGGFDAAELSALIDAGEVTHASLVPLMLRRLLEDRGRRRSPEALRCLLVGGDRAPEDLVREATEAGYPVALTYGMTETASQVATAPPERVRTRPGSVGRPLPGVRVRIADDGEIRVKGPTLSPGRLDGGPLDLDEEGWLRTGDLGSLDEEGRLRVTGRRSDRIVSGGVTVDAREVEAALRALPGIGDAAVVGLTDPEWGERVAAAVVPAGEGAADEGARTRLREKVVGEVRARLAGPKRPRTLRVVDALPTTRTGKVDRGALRRLLEGGRGGEPERRP